MFEYAWTDDELIRMSANGFFNLQFLRDTVGGFTLHDNDGDDYYGSLENLFNRFTHDKAVQSQIHKVEITTNFAIHLMSDVWSVCNDIPIKEGRLPPRCLLSGGQPTTNTLNYLRQPSQKQSLRLRM